MMLHSSSSTIYFLASRQSWSITPDQPPGSTAQPGGPGMDSAGLWEETMSLTHEFHILFAKFWRLVGGLEGGKRLD